MLERKVDGVAIMTSETDVALLAEMTRRNTPMVLLDTGATGDHSANITIQYAQGIREAAEHLFSLNHRRLLYRWAARVAVGEDTLGGFSRGHAIAVV